MHAQGTRPPHWSTKQKVAREWRFRPKDVMVISSVALALSGLMGLGAIMLVELIEKMLNWL